MKQTNYLIVNAANKVFMCTTENTIDAIIQYAASLNFHKEKLQIFNNLARTLTFEEALALFNDVVYDRWTDRITAVFTDYNTLYRE